MSFGAPFIGIDFGTSKSSMAWYNPAIGRAEIIRNAQGDEKTPSVVYFGATDTLVGTPAEDMLEGDEREQLRVVVSVKRDLVNAPRISLPGRRVSPVEVVAAILGKLKRDAEELHFHEPVTRAVITCPATFDSLQEDKIRQAATLAGFTEVELLEEPVAAAIAYEMVGLQVGDYVLVYDLGGGTFDVAVLARNADGVLARAIPARGLQRRGGDDLDRALYDHLDEIAERDLDRPIDPTNRLDLAFLWKCRECKEKLSIQDRVVVNAYFPTANGDAVRFRRTVERAEFEQLIGDEYIEPTIRETQAALTEAGKVGITIDTAVLIGGSSQVPLVQQRLQATLPVPPRKWQNRDLAVALGAAYHANRIWGNEVPNRIVDQTGRGDYYTITEAIQAAQPWDVILVRQGRYSEGLVIDKPLEIIGDGQLGDVLIEAVGANVALVQTTSGRLVNLRLKQNGGGNWFGVDVTQGSLVVDRCDITSESSACIAIHNAANPTLRGNRIHGGKRNGVVVYEQGRGTLEDNDIFGNTHPGVIITTGGDPMLRGNRIRDGGWQGVLVSEQGRGVLENNEIYGNMGCGVEINSCGDPTLGCNRICHNKTNGVHIRDKGRGSLNDNDIFENALNGVVIRMGSNPTLRRNRIHENQKGGVEVWTRRKTTLEDNDISGNKHAGVTLGSSGRMAFRRNKVNNNGYEGVVICSGGRGIFEDNDLCDNKRGPWDIAQDSESNIKRSNNQIIRSSRPATNKE